MDVPALMQLMNIYTNGEESKYIARSGRAKKNYHKGQVKLYFADLVAFLQFVYKRSTTPDHILVIGAANGSHWTSDSYMPNSNHKLVALKVLLDDFALKLGKQITYHFYDPAEFHASVIEQASSTSRPTNLFVYRRLFTADDVRVYNQKDGQILMLSDIRHDTHGQAVRNKNIHQAEAFVEEDMQLQAAFAKSLQCDSVLKFRAPWPHKSKNSDTIENPDYEYLPGDLMYQVFNNESSTEQRLYVEKEHLSDTYLWDTSRIEKTCYHVNTRLRPDWDFETADRIMRTYQNMMQRADHTHSQSSSYAGPYMVFVTSAPKWNP